MSRDVSRIQVLARRVGWMDRWRRVVALSITVALLPGLYLRIRDALETEWRFYPALLATAVAAAVWAFLEVVLAWITAAWETECAQLIRDNPLPRAVLRRRRRRLSLRPLFRR